MSKSKEEKNIYEFLDLVYEHLDEMKRAYNRNDRKNFAYSLGCLMSRLLEMGKTMKMPIVEILLQEEFRKQRQSPIEHISNFPVTSAANEFVKRTRGKLRIKKKYRPTLQECGCVEEEGPNPDCETYHGNGTYIT